MTPPLPTKDPRLALLTGLMEEMPRLVTPEVAPIPPPDPAVLSDPAGLARAAAASSEVIAHAVAELGLPGDDTARAQVLWDETLAQIARIQKLYGFPALPFQSATKLSSLPAALNPPPPPVVS